MRGGGQLRVAAIWLGPDRWLAPAEIAWDANGRIRRLARDRSSGRGRRPWVLFPGLVDAHAHLQIAPVRRAPRAFVPWVQAVMAARGASKWRDWQRQARASLAVLAADGTTAVGEIDATGASTAVLAAGGWAGRCYQEVTGFHLAAAAARARLRERRQPGTPACPSGVSPHAPYSVSPALFAAAAVAARQLAVHCAETPDEQAFLHTGKGPFADLLARLGRLPPGWRAPGVGAVEWLSRLSVLRPGTQLIHCQHLERGDVARIAGSGAAIAVCPGTIEWFGRTPPPLPAWLAAGIPVGLGTDSAASNTGLSMRRELQRAAALWPSLAPESLLLLATRGAARSLGRPGLGQLRTGGRADFLAVDAGVGLRDVVTALVHGALPTLATWRAGRATAASRAPRR